MWMEKLRVIRGAFGTFFVSRVLVGLSRLGLRLTRRTSCQTKAAVANNIARLASRATKIASPKPAAGKAAAAKAQGLPVAKADRGLAVAAAIERADTASTNPAPVDPNRAPFASPFGRGFLRRPLDKQKGPSSDWLERGYSSALSKIVSEHKRRPCIDRSIIPKGARFHAVYPRKKRPAPAGNAGR